jgi:hypothetical protein
VTEVETSGDVEILEHLDFTPEFRCECKPTADGQVCGRTAEWVCRCTACGFAFLYCTKCKAVAQRFLEAGWSIRCRPCGATTKAPRLQVEWIPLGARS